VRKNENDVIEIARIRAAVLPNHAFGKAMTLQVKAYVAVAHAEKRLAVLDTQPVQSSTSAVQWRGVHVGSGVHKAEHSETDVPLNFHPPADKKQTPPQRKKSLGPKAVKAKPKSA